MLLFGAACGSNAEGGPSAATETVDTGEAIENVTVSGEFGQVPQVEIDGELQIDETQSQVIRTGEGEPVVEGEKALLHLYVANGTTGEKAATTYDQDQPIALEMSEDQIFPSVLDAVVGKPAGSRIAVAAVPADAYGEAGMQQLGLSGGDNVLFVVDILSVEPTDVLDGPEGEQVDVPENLPTVESSGEQISGLSWSTAPAKPPKKLQVITLIEGDGTPITGPRLVTMNYLGQVYGAKEPFDNSYQSSPVTFSVGTGQLIPGWETGLEGVREGSRVMLIVPPELGYGESGNPSINVTGSDTMVFLVDILGVG